MMGRTLKYGLLIMVGIPAAVMLYGVWLGYDKAERDDAAIRGMVGRVSPDILYGGCGGRDLECAERYRLRERFMGR